MSRQLIRDDKVSPNTVSNISSTQVRDLIQALKSLKVLFTGELLAGNITITTNTIQVNNPSERGSKIDIKAPYISLNASGKNDSNVSVPSNFIVGNNVLFIDSTNKRIGINTGSPAYQLDVSGNINFTGNLYKNGILYPSNTGGGGSGIIGQLIEDPLPVGSIIPFTNSTVPIGWMKCDGRVVLISEYPELYEAVGNTYGTSDDPMYFKLPDLRGRNIVGDGLGDSLTNRFLGQTGGREKHTLSVNELPSHSHKILASNNEAGLEFADNGKEDVLVGDHGGTYLSSTTNTSRPFLETTGANQPFDIVSPYLVCNYIIKVKSITNDAINIVNGNVGIGLDDPQARLHVRGTTRIDGTLNMSGITYIDTGGRIGIGKIPTYSLDVLGDINLTGDILFNGEKLADPIPVGTVIPYTSTTIPDGWLSCDGRALLRSEYIELFLVIGTTYGAGNGTTTFNIPDLRGRDIIGLGQGDTSSNRVIGEKGGSEYKILTIENIPPHTHNIYVSTSTAGLEFADRGKEDILVGDHGGAYITDTSSGIPFIANTGSGTPLDVMPPFLVCNYIIKSQSIPSLFGIPYNHWTKNNDFSLTYTQGTVIVNSLTINGPLKQTLIDGGQYGTPSNPVAGGQYIIDNTTTTSVLIELADENTPLGIDISNSLVGVTGTIVINERHIYGRDLSFSSIFVFPEYRPKQTVFGINRIKYETLASNVLLSFYNNTQSKRTAYNRTVTDSRLSQLGYSYISSLNTI